MSCPLLTFTQSGYLIQIVDINSHSEWQTVQIQISWLLQKPTDLDLHCLQRQGISGLSRTRVNTIHQMQPFRASSPIQDRSYFHTNMPLFIRKSGAGFYPRNTEYTELRVVRNFGTHFVSFVTIFWKTHL